MKYIRAKDGIYELANERTITEFQVIDHLHNRAFFKDEILAQADTIEELCDEFVYCYRNDMPILVYEEQIKQLILLGRIQDVRGAIWTGKGLIYVAKMNDKGKLVLI